VNQFSLSDPVADELRQRHLGGQDKLILLLGRKHVLTSTKRHCSRVCICSSVPMIHWAAYTCDTACHIVVRRVKCPRGWYRGVTTRAHCVVSRDKGLETRCFVIRNTQIWDLAGSEKSQCPLAYLVQVSLTFVTSSHGHMTPCCA
jgi:hypothetical protein